MADDLDDEERELLQKHRASKKAKQDKADGDLRVQLFNADGSGAEVPYSKGKKWLQDKFGIDLDDEPVQDESGGDDDKGDGDGSVRRFGRRVS